MSSPISVAIVERSKPWNMYLDAEVLIWVQHSSNPTLGDGMPSRHTPIYTTMPLVPVNQLYNPFIRKILTLINVSNTDRAGWTESSVA